MSTTVNPFPLWRFNSAASLEAAALAYAELDIPVFPLEPRGKVPLVGRGLYSATTDANTIRRWWARTPQANIGVPCGKPSGWWALDIDPKHGGLASLEQLQRDVLADTAYPPASLYATRRQLSGGGGAHLIFQARNDQPVQLANAVGFAGYAGIDLRVQGGYIVVAPSRHRSGGLYLWQNDWPLAPFPDALIQHWCRHRAQAFATPAVHSHAVAEQRRRFSQEEYAARAQEPRFYLQIALSRAMVGKRNRYALYLAYRLIEDVGLGWEQAARWMREYVQCVPQPFDAPYTENEALRALDWVVRQVMDQAA